MRVYILPYVGSNCHHLWWIIGVDLNRRLDCPRCFRHGLRVVGHPNIGGHLIGGVSPFFISYGS